MDRSPRRDVGRVGVRAARASARRRGRSRSSAASRTRAGSIARRPTSTRRSSRPRAGTSTCAARRPTRRSAGSTIPILSTMLSGGDDALGDLADVVLHESLHATFYVPGPEHAQREHGLVRRRHARRASTSRRRRGLESIDEGRFIELRKKSEARGKRMKEAYMALETLYASKLPKEEKLAEKKRITETAARRAAHPAAGDERDAHPVQDLRLGSRGDGAAAPGLRRQRPAHDQGAREGAPHRGEVDDRTPIPPCC